MEQPGAKTIAVYRTGSEQQPKARYDLLELQTARV